MRLPLPVRLLIGAASCAAALAARATPPGPYVFPVYTRAAQIDADCRAALAALNSQQTALQAPAAAGDERRAAPLLAALDAITQTYEDRIGPLALLAAVHPDRALRNAADACEVRYGDLNSAFLQSATVYARLKQAEPADEIERRYRRELLDAFEDAGVALNPEQQRRAQAIGARVTRLTQDFDRRVREDRQLLPATARQLAGVPREAWREAPRDAQGRYLLTLDDPVYGPVITLADDPATRERIWRAYQDIGGTGNLATLARLARLRLDYARLFGFDSYAAFVLRRRMAGSVAQVQAFLGRVGSAVAQRELSDLAALREAKALHLQRDPAQTRLQRWDVAYYAEKLGQSRYHVEQEDFRQYFPPEASLRFLFQLASRLFGIRFEPLAQPLWHADARAYVVHDAGDGKLLGTLFIDPYPRPDKYNSAAVWSFRNGSTLTGRLPAAGLVVNVDRRGLSIEELETLLHEFGHALHTLLSATRYIGQAGTSVQMDFVEAPSQMLEAWVYDKRVLALFREVCAECKPVPDDLIDTAARARHFNKGLLFARQTLYSAYDMALYGRKPGDPMALWARMESATPLGHVPGSKLPAGFGHIAGNYAAGYYGYLWSLVLAEDLRTAFAADKLDPAVGRRYRESVLANGGQVAPAELVARFLGRPTDSKAFFEDLNQQ